VSSALKVFLRRFLRCSKVLITLIIIIIIIITDLYSAFRSEDTEALDAAQED